MRNDVDNASEGASFESSESDRSSIDEGSEEDISALTLDMVGDAWSERLETDVDRSVQLMMDEKARVAHGMREVLGTVNQAVAMKEQMNYIDAKLQEYDPDNDDTMVSEFKPTYGFVNRFMLLCAANELTSKVAAPLGPSYRHNLALYSLDTFYRS